MPAPDPTMPPATEPPMNEQPPAESEGMEMAGFPEPPTPTDTIPVDAVTSLSKAVNAAGQFLMGSDFRPVPVKNPDDAERGIGGTKKPVDPMVWQMTMLLAGVVGQAAEKEPSLQDLTFDPNSIATSSGIRDVVAKLDQLSRSDDAKKVIDGLVAEAKAAMGGDGEGKAPPEEPVADEATSEEPAPKAY